MPKNPIDYSKCCIYKIEHIDNENLEKIPPINDLKPCIRH